MIARLNVFFSQRYGGTKLAETEAPQQDVQQQRAGGSAERAWLRPAETVRDWIAVITRIRRTTDSCRRGTMATPRYLEGVLDKSPRERIPPAPIHIDIGWRDVLRKEDDTMRRMLMPTNSGQKSVRFEGGGAPAQERKGLAAFCKTVRDEQGGKGWAVACRDPAVAAAMRHLRQRVQTLSIPEKAVEPSEWGAPRLQWARRTAAAAAPARVPHEQGASARLCRAVPRTRLPAAGGRGHVALVQIVGHVRQRRPSRPHFQVRQGSFQPLRRAPTRRREAHVECRSGEAKVRVARCLPFGRHWGSVDGGRACLAVCV